MIIDLCNINCKHIIYELETIKEDKKEHFFSSSIFTIHCLPPYINRTDFKSFMRIRWHKFTRKHDKRISKGKKTHHLTLQKGIVLMYI